MKFQNTTMPETTRIEYKRELTDGLEKEVVAFLNYNEGGVMYFGIDDDQSVVGLSDPDGDALKIKDRLKNNISPSCLGLFDIVLEEADGLPIIKLILASGSDKPYHLPKYGMTSKGAFIRVGTAAEPMPQKMIDELYAKRTHHSLGKIKSDTQALSFELLRIYYQERGIALNDRFATNLELKFGNDFNYVGYLMADVNSVSIKVAKYSSQDRVALVESNEYGMVSLVKAAKQVLDKINIENRTVTRITPRVRDEQRLWHDIALREAILNAFVHNDYSRELAPKFEFFPDRLEITSAGGLPDGLSESEFFMGYSVPRNKEIMRIFRDLGLCEQLGSGIPRILQFYGKECFSFTDNFLRMAFPSSQPVPPQVPPQVKLLLVALEGEMDRRELQEALGLSDRENFRKSYLQPALEYGVIEMTIPDKPQSSKQRYRLTSLGHQLFNKE